MQAEDKTSGLAASSKIQEGLSFRDRLRATLSQKVNKVEIAGHEQDSKVKGMSGELKSHYSPADSPSNNIASAVKNSSLHTETRESNSEYLSFFRSCDEFAELNGNDRFLLISQDNTVSFHSGSVTFATHIEISQPVIFSFGRLPGQSSKKQPIPYAPPNFHSVPPPIVQDTKTVFNQPWLPPVGEKSHDETFSGSSSAIYSSNPTANQSGYHRDVYHPNRRSTPFSKKRQSDFFGRMVPAAYPPMPGAFDYHSPFQVPFHQHGIPSQNASRIPPNFPHPHFMNSFHPPNARQSGSTRPDMYGMMPNGMNYGPQFPINYGSH